ncbi:MAG: hypothetical protein ABIA37_00790 [Candidatus Woesearchaeota archaeon]
MKITIDTKEDSKEEIKKAIQLLSSLVKEEVVVNQDVFSSDQETNNSFANMFGGEEPVPEKTVEPDQGTPINFSGFMDLVNKKNRKEDDEDFPQITSY